MTIISLLEGNFAPCVSIVFLLVFLLENNILDKNVKKNFYLLIALELLELIAYNIELWTVTLPDPTILRKLMSAIGYTVRPFLVYVIVRLNTRNIKNRVINWLLLVPAILNAFAAFSVFFTDLVYSYDAFNQFHRGPLGYTTQIVTVLYMLLLLCKALNDMRKKQNGKRMESVVLLLIMIYLSSTMVLEAVFLIRTIGRTAIVLSTTFYYMFFQTQKYRNSIDIEYQSRISAEQRAKRDVATGLLNKIGFQEGITDALSASTETENALLFIDLDHFKNVNDNLGHISGDLLLQEFASMMRGFWDQKDILGRFGGDEFCVFVQGLAREQLCDKMEQLLERMRSHYPNEKYPMNITLSIGMAFMEKDDKLDPEALLALADQAVYKAKDAGRDRYMIIGVGDKTNE